MKVILVPTAAFVGAFGLCWFAIPTRQPATVANTSEPVVAERPETGIPKGVQHREIDSAMAPVRAAKDRAAAIQAALQLARRLSPDEQKAWLDGGWFKFPDSLVGKVFTDELEALLFDHDPAAFVTSQLDLKRASARRNLDRLANLDPEGVIALGQASEDSERKKILILAAAKALAERDPARTLKLLLELPAEQEVSLEMVRLLGKASEDDTTKLLKLAEDRGDRWRPLLRATALQSMADKDFAAAMRWAGNEEDGAKLFAILFSPGLTIHQEAQRISKIVADNLDSIPDGFGGKLDKLVLGGWPAPYLTEDCEETWLKTDLKRLGLDPASQRQLRYHALVSLGEKDPQAAAKWLMTDAFRPKDRSLIVSDWMIRLARSGEKLPPELLAVMDEPLLAKVRSFEERQAAKKDSPPGLPTVPHAFAVAMAEKDPPALMLPGSTWTDTQIQEAISYVSGRNQAEIEDMTKRLHYTGSPIYPVNAEIYRQALLKNISTRYMTNELIEMSVKWSAKEPLQAAAWAESLPASKERDYSIRNIAVQWSRQDPKQADRWISSLKDPAEIQAAREAISHSSAKSK